MCPQIACLNGCKVTLVAFVWFFSTVCFQMSPQIARIRGCIVALVAFLWPFSTVCFQMCPQRPCMRGCIVAVMAFLWLFPTMGLQMSPQTSFLRGCICTLVAFVWNVCIVCIFCGKSHIANAVVKISIFDIFIHGNFVIEVLVLLVSVSNWKIFAIAKWIEHKKWKWNGSLKEIFKMLMCNSYTSIHYIPHPLKSPFAIVT